MTTEAMRAQFEAWIGDDGEGGAFFGKPRLEVDGENEFIDPDTYGAWLSWQAALRSPAVAGLVEAAGRVERRLNPLLSGKLQDVDHADFVAFFAAIANFTGDKP